jgi:hypothetical protein
LATALAVGGCSTQDEWLAKHPGEHCWFVFDRDRDRGRESCAACGTVRKDDDSNKPCKGIVTVELRDRVTWKARP